MKRTIFACVVLTIAGCADTRDTGGGVVRAAEGGTVEIDAFRIEIAPNALAEDTDVSLAVGDPADYPPRGGEYRVLVLEPEGTVLETPAEVTIDGAFVGANEGDTVYVSRLAADFGWVVIEHATNEDGSLSTFVSQLAPLAIDVGPAASVGSIEGTLSWGEGSPVATAPVQLLASGSPVASTTSDEAGHFSFSDLTPGAYRILVEYECTLMADVEVAAGAPTPVDLTLCASP